MAVYLSIGVDLRLMEEADFRRTELIKQPERVEALRAPLRVALLHCFVCRIPGWQAEAVRSTALLVLKKLPDGRMSCNTGGAIQKRYER